MHFIKLSHCLYLHQHRIINQNIREIFSDDLSFILHMDTVLLSDRKSEFAKFQSQCVFINLFEKSTAQDITDLVSTTNYALR